MAKSYIFVFSNILFSIQSLKLSKHGMLIRNMREKKCFHAIAE